MTEPETWMAYFRGCCTAPMKEGIAGFFNNEATELKRYFEVREVRALPPSGVSASTIGNLRLALISAVVGGDALDFVKANSAAAAMPAQVVCVRDPGSVTITNTLRQRSLCPSLDGRVTASNIPLSTGVNGAGSKARSLDPASLFRSLLGEASGPIILREGEGIALLLHEVGHPAMVPFEVSVTVLATGATYHVNSSTSFTPGYVDGAAWALLNGSGSGVVLKVSAVRYPENFEALQAAGTTIATRYGGIPNFQLALLDGYPPGQGTDITPTAMKSSNAALAGYKALRGPFVPYRVGELRGAKRFRLIPMDGQMPTGGDSFSPSGSGNVDWLGLAAEHYAGVIREGMPPLSTVDVGQSHVPNGGRDVGLLYKAGVGQQGIILRPGQGIGVLGNAIQLVGSIFFVKYPCLRNHVWNTWDIAITFVHVPPATVAGTGISRSRIFATA